MKFSFIYSVLLLLLIDSGLPLCLYSQQAITIGGGETASNKSNPGVQPGTESPNIRFADILNAPANTISIRELRGKIVVIEFWATWCSPCLPAMDHLNDLKNKFPGMLEVIAVSDESTERIKKYITNKPSSLWFATDPNHTLMEHFPYQTIPHTVVIDREGKVAASCLPSDLTEQSVQSLISGEKISLPQKKPLAATGFDMTKDYFPKSVDFNDYSFQLQPPIPGGFPMRRRKTPKDGVVILPELTLLNSPLNHILQAAFDYAPSRIEYEGVKENEFDYRTTNQLYCVNVSVPREKKDELLVYFQQKLNEVDFEFGFRIEKRKKECVVIKCIDPTKLEHLKINGNDFVKGDNTQQPGIVYANKFEKSNVAVSELISHLDKSGFYKRMPVLDETAINGKYNLSIEIERENPASLRDELAKLGLKAEKQEREVEMLVIYKK